MKYVMEFVLQLFLANTTVPMFLATYSKWLLKHFSDFYPFSDDLRWKKKEDIVLLSVVKIRFFVYLN